MHTYDKGPIFSHQCVSSYYRVTYSYLVGKRVTVVKEEVVFVSGEVFLGKFPD